jgi:signal transduction histidine kinase
MLRPRLVKVLRWLCLVALAFTAFDAVAFIHQISEDPAEVKMAGAVLVILFFVAFGLGFWWSSGRGPTATPSRTLLAVMTLQLLIAGFLWTDLRYFLAAQIPFVFTPRRAVRWMVLLYAVGLLSGLLSFPSEEFVVMRGTEHLPPWVAFSLTVLGTFTLQGLCFCAAFLASTESQARADLARVNAELRATQELLADSTRLAERLQISRELHDTLGHHLTVLSLNLEHAKQVAEGRAAAPIADAQAVTRLLLADVRGVVGELRDDRALDLRGALETLAAGTPEPKVHLSFGDGVEVQDPAQAHILFRCVQEAITNAVRHARARNLWIVLTPEAEGVALRIRDDGDGVPEVRPGNGLTGMRERVEETGGRLEVESQPGTGFSLTAWVPSPAGWP